MQKQANIPRYIKLISDDHITISDGRLWFKTVMANAPSGVLTSIDSLDLNGQPVTTRMVRRSYNDKTEFIIPLMRDMLPSELEKVADAWKRVSPPGNFSIAINPTQDQKLNQAVAELTLPQDEYQALCAQLAKVQHAGWIREKAADGWSYGTVLSLKNKTHPLMMSWDSLPEKYRDINTKNPENFLNFINSQGFAVVKQSELGSLLKILRNIN
jgi:hypothetical protein